MTGRERVWAALNSEVLPHPPKGEIIIEAAWLATNKFTDLSAAITYLQTDLAVLPVLPTRSLITNWQEWKRQSIFLFGCLQGPVTYFSERDGWHAFSRLLIKQPIEAVRVMAQFIDQSIQAALTALEQGCDGFIVFDDLAGDRGLLINPQLLETLYFPLIQTALERLNHKDVPILFHSDGNILPITPILHSIGFWGIQGLQPSVGIGPDDFRQLGLQDWLYWGNFEFEGQGRLKQTEEIALEVRSLLTSWSDFPGFIFGSSGGLYKGLTLPEITRAYRTVENWRR